MYLYMYKCIHVYVPDGAASGTAGIVCTLQTLNRFTNIKIVYKLYIVVQTFTSLQTLNRLHVANFKTTCLFRTAAQPESFNSLNSRHRYN